MRLGGVAETLSRGFPGLKGSDKVRRRQVGCNGRGENLMMMMAIIFFFFGTEEDIWLVMGDGLLAKSERRTVPDRRIRPYGEQRRDAAWPCVAGFKTAADAACLISDGGSILPRM